MKPDISLLVAWDETALKLERLLHSCAVIEWPDLCISMNTNAAPHVNTQLLGEISHCVGFAEQFLPTGRQKRSSMLPFLWEKKKKIMFFNIVKMSHIWHLRNSEPESHLKLSRLFHFIQMKNALPGLGLRPLKITFFFYFIELRTTQSWSRQSTSHFEIWLNNGR